ncbi:kinesin-like protein KIF27 [Cheilinus undulatus]|uniref:kinesin-like protein KIF27 n=1 Tax=Cheilinus undulatus TaxID=241271 RepID=UPI001BD57FC1|nr:kinesin-like protein KIF27 [Cheilinus undulatus]
MGEECVRVAVRVRPLLRTEILRHHRECIREDKDTSQVVVGLNKVFTFDHTFGPTASQEDVYKSCVRPLVENLVEGFNATVFCFGQTGSGKTYTLLGGYGGEQGGIIEHVAHDIFLLLEQKRASSDGVGAAVQVSYIELHKDELRDLLEELNMDKTLHIRQDEKGNTVVVGSKAINVTSAEEVLDALEMGNALRHTATTGMNEHSSRSHTIFTFQLHQSFSLNNSDCFSKLCLVDLAGSERAEKTGNMGVQLKESCFINKDLLMLGKVIRALSESTRKPNTFIPFRASKITRLLRDSLGGNAHTLMMACVSPSNHSEAETESVLRYASMAREINTHPGRIYTYKTCLDRCKARLSQTESEALTPRQELRDKKRDLRRARKNGRPGQEKLEEVVTQYRLLAQEAAALFVEMTGSSHSFKPKIQEWLDRLTAANLSYEVDCSEGGDGQPQNVLVNTLHKELGKCKEALTIEEQLLKQKDAELRQVQKEVEKLLKENKSQLQALEEEKERSRIQTEQLVDQQILIDRLRNDLMAFRSPGVPGASGNMGRRPHSVPLIGHSWAHGTPRRIHSSPPAYSLERVLAAFKMRGHLLLAEIEEKDEVYCPFIKQQAERKDRDREQHQEEEGDISEGGMRFRNPLNQTCSSRQKKSTLKEKNTGTDQTSNESPCVQQPQRAQGNKEKSIKQSGMRKPRLRTNATQRRINNLTVSIDMKEDLINALNKTDEEARAVDWHGKEDDVLTRLSMQRQKARSEVYHSLQHMRVQRAQLQSSLRQLDQKGEQRAEDITVGKSSHLEELEKKLHGSCWLDEEEDQVLQKRAELQELEEELERREEVLLHKETCLQQKNKLEIKKLRASQALSHNLHRISVQLESVEEEMKRSSVRQTGGVTIEELEKEREVLKKRKDTLDTQLKDNRVLTTEDEHSLLELEEAIEVLDAALEFKNGFIQEKQKKLSVTDSSTHQLQSTEPAQLCGVIRKLKELSQPEALDLLIRYFNKVVYLREMEHRLRLHCEEQQIHTEKQEVVVKELKVAMQRVTLNADRRLTQQQRDHQSDIQLLLQKLREAVSGEAVQERLQHLEKELFFYKSSSRQLKKKLRELHSDASHSFDQLGEHTSAQENRQTHTSANTPQTRSEEVQTRTHIVTTYTKIHSEQIDQQTHSSPHLKSYSLQAPCPSSSAALQVHKDAETPEHHQIQTSSQGRKDRGAGLEMEPVRLCRKDLRQIFPAELKVCGSNSRRRQSALDTSSESILVDSIEVAKNTDR